MGFFTSLGSNRRTRILATFILIMSAIFVLRLFYLQIIQHNYYVKVAASEQIKRLTIPASRGEIYALSGSTPVPLAMNQTVYTVFADPYAVTDESQVIKVIEAVAGGSAQPNLKGLLDQKMSRYAILAKEVSSSQATKIKSYDLTGVGFQAVSQRVYPEGALAAQVLGFVNTDGVGQYGIEQGMNKQLSGTDGLLQAVTDVSDVPLTIGSEYINKPAQNGENVVLSIDRNVQSEVEQALSDGLKKNHATNGSVLVMDPTNGHVMAMANLPTYDPSDYGNASSDADYDNPIISDPYEPGSDVKTLMMATGVDNNVVSPSTTYDNQGYMVIDGVKVSNADGLGHYGTIDLQTAMNFSLNSGFITVAEKLGDGSNITKQARDTIYNYYTNHFHLGTLTGIQLAGEAPGTIISPDDPSGQGNAVRYSNMAFGQGLDATMLQMASAFSSIVDNGQYHKPTVVAGTVDADGNYTPAATTSPTQSIKASTANTVKQMIVTARGTLFSASDPKGYTVGGKTGTSQAIVNGQYSYNQTIGTYLGFGGDATPRYVIMVQVSGNNMALQGGRDAEPIFATISSWLLKYLAVPPES